MYDMLKKAQPRVLQILENSKKTNRLSHAYLFTGPKGSFKKEMAYYFALMLYCKEEKPCYNCSTCHAILNNNHMNVFYIEPIGQGIKKEQIIALQEEFSKTSLVPGPRVYIINEADTMNQSAANSLLKFIEEPVNEETYGILITEHKDNMLSTIVSRSIVMNFDAVRKDVLHEEFKTLGTTDLYIDALTYLTNNYAEAKAYLDDESFTSVMNVFSKFVTQLYNNGPIGLFYRANQDILGNRDNLKQFLILIEFFFRDIFEYQNSKKILTYHSLLTEITYLAQMYSSEDILNYLQQILELQKKIGYNVNMNLLVNQFLINLRGGI